MTIPMAKENPKVTIGVPGPFFSERKFWNVHELTSTYVSGNPLWSLPAFFTRG